MKRHERDNTCPLSDQADPATAQLICILAEAGCTLAECKAYLAMLGPCDTPCCRCRPKN